MRPPKCHIRHTLRVLEAMTDVLIGQYGPEHPTIEPVQHELTKFQEHVKGCEECESD